MSRVFRRVTAMQECERCHGRMERRTTTAAQPYNYRLSGLDNVRLVGIQVQRCPRCDVELPAIPRIGELHRVIARTLLDLDRPLQGQEIRYLRKFAGVAAQDFAALLGVRPEHLSRVENGHTATLGASADRLTRGIAALALNDPDTVRQVLTAAARAERRRRPRPVTLVAGRRWKLAA